MVLKVYISGMSGNKEVKKRQQRVLMILDSKNIKYECIDITEPGKEAEKELMQVKSSSSGATVSDPNPRHPLPPQIFNDAEYCGDYDQFDLNNEIDTLEQFCKLSPAEMTSITTAQIELNTSTAKDDNDEQNKENGEQNEEITKSTENEGKTTTNGTSSREEAAVITTDDGADSKKPLTESENLILSEKSA